MALAIRFDELICDGVLADHDLSYVEGRAIEDERLIQAANEGSLLDVLVLHSGEKCGKMLRQNLVKCRGCWLSPPVDCIERI